MKRKIIKDLRSWLQRPDRKPLIIRGARQTGKTWLVRHLAAELNFDLLELNFERDPTLQKVFADNDPQKTVMQLEALFNKEIKIEQTILFLDEIQATPTLLAKLRWFAEEMPELAVVATGSLLDFTLDEHEFSMPVGRISYFYLEPLSFEEFLLAIGQHKLHEFLINYRLTEEIPSVIHERLWQFLREYMFVGGLPEAVNNWVQKSSFVQVSEIQQNILTTYQDDFAKYAKRTSHEQLSEVFGAVPTLIGKKFKYSAVNRDVRTEVTKKALNLLCKARVCHKILNSSATGIPLGATSNEKIFKVILLDVGLVSRALGLPSADITAFNNNRLVNEGALAEQFVGQMLRATNPYYIDPKLYYWLNEKPGSEAEVDYLLQHNTEIIPIEVKSGSTGTLRSLHSLMQHKNLTKAIRLNADYPSITNINYQLISLPLYLTEQLPRLLT